MQESPAFSSFRKIIDIWDKATLLEDKKKEAKQGKVKNIIDGKNLIMFFRSGSSLFVAPEESRIAFARLKNPSKDDPPEDLDGGDMNFNAFDLIKALSGDSIENIFSGSDIPNIDIITRDEVEDSLMKCPCQEM